MALSHCTAASIETGVQCADRFIAMGQPHHPDPGDYPVTLMSNVRESLAAIEALPLRALCGS